MTIKNKASISELFEKQSAENSDSILIENVMELPKLVRMAFQLIAITTAYGVFYFVGATL